MTREDIIRMAREAGAIHIHGKPNEFAIVGNDSIKAFAALVAAAEREACAALADKLEWADNKGVASAIRARGQA
jgi:hypothetical protein